MARSDKEQVEEPQEGMRQTVADVLATAREEYGQDLRSVSDALRIRYVYLQAIEEGRFDDLPGLTYAVGFVRSYSDYLGLDTPTVVQQFKEEMGGASQRQQLVFPVPKPEGKIPAGALVLISILLVALAYGGWYVLSQDDQSFMEMFSGEETAPDSDADEPQSAPAPEPTPEPEPESNAGGSGESEQASAPAPAPAPAPSVVEEIVEETAETVTQTAESAVEGVADGASNLGAELLSSSEGSEILPSAESGTADAIESEVLPAPEEEAPAVELAETQTPDTTSGTVEEAAAPEGQIDSSEDTLQSATLPDAPAIAAPEDAAAGEVFGAAADEPVRVIIEATHDSWVQVFDEENELLIARVLRSGDQFRVPNTEGISMLTGNAGGLEVMVDGAVAPSLGPFGEVVRNIALDPVLLLNGTAVGAAANPEQ